MSYGFHRKLSSICFQVMFWLFVDLCICVYPQRFVSVVFLFHKEGMQYFVSITLMVFIVSTN